eukprot:1024209-Pelagomonas_calceolata.AAC.1
MDVGGFEVLDEVANDVAITSKSWNRYAGEACSFYVCSTRCCLSTPFQCMHQAPGPSCSPVLAIPLWHQ